MRDLRILIVAIAALALAGCGVNHRFGNDPPLVYPTDHSKIPVTLPGVYGGKMSSMFLGDPKTFNVWVCEDADSQALGGELFDTLEGQDPFTLKFIPRLAYLPKISKDGLTYTYTLRPNLKWSDGVPITADDVIFTLDLIFDPNTQTALKDTMLIDVTSPDGITKHVPFGYKKIDDRTVQFTLPTTWAPAESSTFGFPIAPKHALEKAYKAGQINSVWGVNTPPSQLACSGPFLMSKYVPGQHLILSPNPYFWRYSNNQHLPYLSSFDYLIVPDTNTQALLFRGGMSDTFTIPTNQYPNIARYAKRDNYTVVDRGADWGFSYFSFNMNPTSTMDKRLLRIFSDKRFRQACSYAIDRQRICNTVSFGLSHPLYGPETPADVNYYDPNVRQYPYDPAKAKQLLFDMGMKQGSDGKMLFEGKPVTFDIITNVENRGRVATVTIISDNLNEIGINATFTPINFNKLIQLVDQKPYDWQAMMLGFTGSSEPNSGGDMWRSSGQYHQWWPRQKTPATPWEARIDNDFSQGAHKIAVADRKKYYDDFQEVVGDEQPVIFLTYQQDYTAVRNHFGNIKPSPAYGLGGDVFWNLEEVFDTHAKGYTR